MATILERQRVIYCEACGMPPEYCEYSPDFETHCDPWLKKNQPELHSKLKALRNKFDTTKLTTGGSSSKDDEPKVDRPTEPWTTEERLVAFYEKYVPEKVDGVPALLEKYAGKEAKLFDALVKKYGPEPEDPYYADEDGDSDDLEEEVGAMSLEATGGDGDKKKRRGAGAKKKDGKGTNTRVIVTKEKKNKRRFLTIITGMDTVPDIKLKDVSKAFSKRFAGSSSVKDGVKGKEIIIQGDHMHDVAEMIVDKFGVPDTAVYLDMDGDLVPLR